MVVEWSRFSREGVATTVALKGVKSLMAISDCFARFNISLLQSFYSPYCLYKRTCVGMTLYWAERSGQDNFNLNILLFETSCPINFVWQCVWLLPWRYEIFIRGKWKFRQDKTTRFALISVFRPVEEFNRAKSCSVLPWTRREICGRQGGFGKPQTSESKNKNMREQLVLLLSNLAESRNSVVSSL